MATLAEEMEKYKKRHPELMKKGMISVADPNTPGPRPGLVTSDTLTSPEFRKGEARTSFLEKIGARYTEDVGGEGMTWQEKTGIQLYDPAAQKRFLFRKSLKEAAEAPYRTQAMRHAKLAEIIGADISAERKAGVDIATGLMTAETTRERTGVMEAADIETKRHRGVLETMESERLGVARTGLESLDISRKATARYQAGMLKVAEKTRPGSVENRVAKLELQKLDALDKNTAKYGAAGGEIFGGALGESTATKNARAIVERYDKEIEALKAGMGPGKAVRGVKAPSYEKVVQTYKDIGQTPPTREEWDALLASEEGKKRYPGGR